jgi:putative RNA 2'-phosphotransferase
MLRECKVHGTFRGEICPQCGDEGRFILSDEEMERLTRMMAGCLRHFPQKYGLKLDQHGWASIDDLVTGIIRKVPRFRFLKPSHIHAIVQTDDKGRYEIKNGLIRATYGHTLNIDLDLPTDNIPSNLFYPVPKSKCEEILRDGIKPVRRNKVHLSGSVEACVKAGVSIKEDIEVLEVDAEAMQKDGIKIMRAGKVVYLTDHVPPQYLKKYKKGIKHLIEEARAERERVMASRPQKQRHRTEGNRGRAPSSGGEDTSVKDEDNEPKWDFP